MLSSVTPPPSIFKVGTLTELRAHHLSYAGQPTSKHGKSRHNTAYLGTSLGRAATPHLLSHWELNAQPLASLTSASPPKLPLQAPLLYVSISDLPASQPSVQVLPFPARPDEFIFPSVSNPRVWMNLMAPAVDGSKPVDNPLNT